MSFPRISLVTPSFQQAAFLEEAIGSVLGQGYGDLEYFVCDGGSTDGSREIILRHEGRLAWWCSQKDAGQTQAINKGLRRATGEVVGWLNSDDLLLPGALAEVGRAFADPACQAVCGWCVAIDQAGRRTGQKVYPQPTADVLLRRSILPQPTVFWRRGLLETVGFLDESFHVCMDLDYWVRLAQAGAVPRLIRRYQAAFRRHDAQKTSLRDGRWDDEESAIWRRLHGPGADRRALRRSTPWTWRAKYSCMKRWARWGLYGRP